MTRFHLIILAAALFAGAGCKNCGKRLFRKDSSSAPRFENPAMPAGSDPLIPPPSGGLPTPSLDIPSSSSPPPAPSSSDLPPPTIPETRNKAPSSKELVLPDPLPGESSSKPKGPNRNLLLEAPADPRKTESPSKPNLVKDVPGFTVVRDGVATGRKPGLEGLENLKSSGYRTIIYLHAASADVGAARTVIEKRGLVFLPIAIEPETIKSGTDRFLEAVGDAKNKPVYVCDEDGLRTGAAWYAWFRQAEAASDDTAQVRAGTLGWRDAKAKDREAFLKALQEQSWK
jgi:hypothetical protein